MTMLVQIPLSRFTVAASLLNAEAVFQLANQLAGRRVFILQRLSEDGLPQNLPGCSFSVAGDWSMLGAGQSVLVPPIGGQPLAALGELQPLLSQLIALRQQAFSGQIASLCTGAFVLAEAGWLDGLPATTHWALARTLRDRYPRVQVRAEAMQVRAGQVHTSGGAEAALDLCLSWVAAVLGADLARQVADYMLLDWPRPSQSGYQHWQPDWQHGDLEILQIQRHLHQHWQVTPSLAELAARVHVSPRTLLRRFKAATGLPPLAYLQQIRLEQARTLLLDTQLTIEAIAGLVGYQDRASFQVRFRETFGLSPARFRQSRGALLSSPASTDG